MSEVFFAGTGSFLPGKILTNADLERMVDTSNEWIIQRTGIRERRIVAEGQATATLAIGAARGALAAAGKTPDQVGGIIVATITPDTCVPACAAYVQSELGAKNAFAVDLNAACTGFVYASAFASALVRTGTADNILVIGAESLSRIVDYTDRNSCILFGDGAGAALICRSPEASPGPRSSRIIDSYLRADGSLSEFIIMPAGGSRKPASAETVAAREHYLRMNGKEVFKFATRALIELIETALGKNGFGVQDLDLVIPHQVNYRIIESAQKKLDLPLEKFYLNLERFGNTSAASVPIALDEAVQGGRLKRGNLVLLVAFGAGMTWGYNLVRW